MEKLTKSKLRERGIVNCYDFCRAGGGRVWLNYRSRDKVRRAAWQVIGVGFATDPKAPWFDYGCKTFRGKIADEAKRWAGERYSITEWVRDPFGGWQDARVYAKVVGE